MRRIAPNVAWYAIEELKAAGPFDNIRIQISMRNKNVGMTFTVDASQGTTCTVKELPWMSDVFDDGVTIHQVAAHVLGAALEEGLLSLAKPFTVNFLNLDGMA